MTVYDESNERVCEVIRELAELLEVRSIVAIVAQNSRGTVCVIGPASSRDITNAIADGISKELLARGLAL